MVIFVVFLLFIIEFEFFLGLLHLVIATGQFNIEEPLHFDIKVGFEARFLLLFRNSEVTDYRNHSGKLPLDMHALELHILILDGELLPIYLRPDSEPYCCAKAELLVTHYNNAAFYSKTDSLGSVAHLHRNIVEHNRHSAPEGTLIASRIPGQGPFSCVEIGLTVGACHALAILFLLILIFLLVTLLACQQTLVEVGDTHILERDIRQLEVNLFGTCNAYLTIETELHKSLLALGQSVAIDYIEICTVLVELHLCKHEVKTDLIINLLHLEVHGKAIFLTMSHRLDIGKVAYLGLFGSIFLAQERHLDSTVKAGTAEAVLLYIKVYVVECYFPPAHLWSAVCKEAVY